MGFSISYDLNLYEKPTIVVSNTKLLMNQKYKLFFLNKSVISFKFGNQTSK